VQPYPNTVLVIGKTMIGSRGGDGYLLCMVILVMYFGVVHPNEIMVHSMFLADDLPV
jgi:hypothetical protein